MACHCCASSASAEKTRALPGEIPLSGTRGYRTIKSTSFKAGARRVPLLDSAACHFMDRCQRQRMFRTRERCRRATRMWRGSRSNRMVRCSSCRRFRRANLSTRLTSPNYPCRAVAQMGLLPDCMASRPQLLRCRRIRRTTKRVLRSLQLS